jgi:hypothetical protein
MTALDFALEYQEISQNCENCKSAIKQTIEKFLDQINKSLSTAQTIVFNDSSSVTWYGNGWTVKE